MKIILGVTGASGAIYARLLTEELLRQECVQELVLIMSANGRAVAGFERQAMPVGDSRVMVFDNDDMFAPPASGSADYDAMAIVPCSMGTVARVACGVSDTLITRAADVMLKERRRLVVVPREAPLSAIHMRNMLTLGDCGAVVVPASPAFYSHPADIEQLCMSVVERIVAHLGIDAAHHRWQGKQP